MRAWTPIGKSIIYLDIGSLCTKWLELCLLETLDILTVRTVYLTNGSSIRKVQFPVPSLKRQKILELQIRACGRLLAVNKFKEEHFD